MDDDNPQVKQLGGNHQPGGVLNMVQEWNRKTWSFTIEKFQQAWDVGQPMSCVSCRKNIYIHITMEG
jgi:hypothetical protein